MRPWTSHPLGILFLQCYTRGWSGRGGPCRCPLGLCALTSVLTEWILGLPPPPRLSLIPKAHTGLSDSAQFFLNPGADFTQAMTARNFLLCLHEAASSGGAQIASGNGVCCQGARGGEEVRNLPWQWHNLSGSLSFCSWNKPAGTMVMLTHHQPGCTRSPTQSPSSLFGLSMQEVTARWGFLGGTGGKECRRHKTLRFDPWVGKIPRRRAWQPPPVFLPGASQGQKKLAGYSPWGHKQLDMTEMTRHSCTLSSLGFHCVPSVVCPRGIIKSPVL